MSTREDEDVDDTEKKKKGEADVLKCDTVSMFGEDVM